MENLDRLVIVLLKASRGLAVSVNLDLGVILQVVDLEVEANLEVRQEVLRAEVCRGLKVVVLDLEADRLRIDVYLISY